MLLSGFHLRVLILSVKSWELLHDNCSPEPGGGSGTEMMLLTVVLGRLGGRGRPSPPG